MLRRVALVTALSLVAACGATPSPRSAQTPRAACFDSDLPRCEKRIAQALREGQDPSHWTAPYLTARALALGESDGWVALGARLRSLPQQGARSVLVASAAQLSSLGIETKTRFRADRPQDLVPLLVETSELPQAQSLTPEELFFCLTQLAKTDVAVWVREQALVVAIARDPLAPLIYSVPSFYVEALKDLQLPLAEEIARAFALELTTNQAIGLLGANRFREAGEVVTTLQNWIAALAPQRAIGSRARYLASKRGHFGLEGKPQGMAARLASLHSEPQQAPARQQLPSQGAYVAWLRTLESGPEDKEAWSRQREIVRLAVTPSRLEGLDYLLGYEGIGAHCGNSRSRPEDLLRGELLFANRLAQDATQGAITPAHWARGYEALLRRVESTHTAWAAIHSLLYQRGDLPGLSTRGSAQYRRVTRLTLDYLEALKKFQSAAPQLYQPAGQLLVTLSPAALSDPELAPVLQSLLSDNVKTKLVPAAEGDKILEAVLLSALAALSLPPPVQGTYFGALSRELSQKLLGPLREQAGWDIALLYAVGAFAEYLLDGKADLAFASQEIRRALETKKDLPARPVATILSRSSQYAALAAAERLEPEKVGPAQFGPDRSAARASLKAALRDLAQPGEKAPEAPLEALSSLLDGMIATGVLAFVSGRKASSESQERCVREPSASSPRVLNNLRTLAPVRDRLLRDPALWDGKSLWGRRARVLLVLLSDTLDMLLAPPGKSPEYRLAVEVSSRALLEGVSEGTSPDRAKGVVALHRLVRAGTRNKGAWKDLLESNALEIVAVLRALGTVVGVEDSLWARVGDKVGLEIVNAAVSRPTSTTESGFATMLRALYLGGRPEEAGVASLLASRTTAESTSAGATLPESLALEHKSPVAWALSARRIVAQTRAGVALEATQYERALAMMTEDRCKAAQTTAVVAAARAVSQFARGEREAATRALDALLSHAETEGLVIPKSSYRLVENLGPARALVLTVPVSAAQGFVKDSSPALGLEAVAEQRSSGLKVEVSTQPAQEAGRFYAHIAAVASVYHFLQGHDALAARDASRALTAIASGVRLGAQSVIPSSPNAWTADSREILLLLHELALQRNQPLLAAKALASVLELESDSESGKALQAVALRGLSGLEEPLQRAEQSRRLALQARHCSALRPSAAPEARNCEELRRGLALRRLGVYSGVPKVQAGMRESCYDDQMLGDILEQLSAQRPVAGWPEKFTERVTRLLGRTVRSGYAQDARVLLDAVREAQVCSQALVEVAREAGRRAESTPQDRVEWLSYALSCPGRKTDDTTWDDLNKLAEAGERLPEPTAAYRVDAAVVRFLVEHQAWQRLLEFSRRGAFVEHLDRVGPAGSAAALAIELGAAILAGQKPEVEASRSRYELACVQFGDAGRDQVCREVGVLRNRSLKEPVQALTDTSRRLLEIVVAQSVVR